MSNYLKPQSPLYHKKEDAYFYPLTTADQVIMEDGNRLNTVFKSTVRKTVTLLAANWSADAPYTQTVTVSDVNFDDLNVDVHVAYTGNKESDLELNKDYSCISYVKKNGNSVTFSCLKDKPAIDMPVEIVGTSCDSIATVEEGTKLNFDIVAYDTEEELLADTPMENTIGIVTTTPISKWIFDSNEPENPVDGMLWIKVGTESQVEFNVIKDTDIPIYPISAKQYVGGVWVDVTCFSFLDGEWISWWPGTYIYNSGDQCTTYTGGWERKSYSSNSGVSITFNDSNIVVNSTQAVACLLGCKSFDKTLLAKYNTMYIEYTLAKNLYLDGAFGIVSTYSISDFDDSGICLARKNINKAGTYTESVDITKVTSGYPFAYSYGAKLTITKIWFE